MWENMLERVYNDAMEETKKTVERIKLMTKQEKINYLIKNHNMSELEAEAFVDYYYND